MKKIFIIFFLIALLIILSSSAFASVNVSQGNYTTAINPPSKEHMVKDSIGILHAIFTNDNRSIVYTNSTNNGTSWSSLQLIQEAESISEIAQLNLIIRSNNMLYAFWMDGNSTYWSNRTENQDWSTPSKISGLEGNSSESFNELSVAIDSRDIIHLVVTTKKWRDSGLYTAIYTNYSDEDGWWNDSSVKGTGNKEYTGKFFNETSTSFYDVDIEVDTNNDVYFITNDYSAGQHNIKVFSNKDNWTNNYSFTPINQNEEKSSFTINPNTNQLYISFETGSYDLAFANTSTEGWNSSWDKIIIDADSSFFSDIEVSDNNDTFILYDVYGAVTTHTVFRANTSLLGIGSPNTWDNRTRLQENLSWNAYSYPTMRGSTFPVFNRIKDRIEYLFVNRTDLDIYFDNFTIRFIDTSPPIWNNTRNLSVGYNQSLAESFKAWDLSGVDSYLINDTTNFKISTAGLLENKTALSIGTYSLNISANDTGNIYNTNETIEITITNTIPSFNETLTGNYNINHNSSIEWALNATDVNGQLLIWSINNTILSINPNAINGNDTANLTNTTWKVLSTGDYLIRIDVSDGTNNNSMNFTLSITNNAPAIPTTTYPSDLATIGYVSTWLNYSSLDQDGDQITYFVYADTNTNPTTLVYNGTNQFHNLTGLSNGNTYYWTVVASDNQTNSTNSSIKSFAVSTDAPAITPNIVNGEWITFGTQFHLNATAVDGNGIDTCYLYHNLTGWGLNQTITGITSGVEFNSSLFTFTNERRYNYTYWCNDSAGSEGWYAFGNITFGVDTKNPSLTISSPSNDYSTTSTTITLTSNASDTYLDTCLYEVRYKDTDSIYISNTTFTCNNQTSFNAVAYAGGYELNVTVNDSAGNFNTTYINFTITTASGTSGVGGGKGGTISQPVFNCKEQGKNWTIKTPTGGDAFFVYLGSKGTKTKRKKAISLRNLDTKDVIINLKCDESIENATAGFCQYVTINETTIRLPANSRIDNLVEFTIETPPDAKSGKNYYFAILVTDGDTCEKKLDVQAQVHLIFSKFFKTIKMFGLVLPTYIVSLILSLISMVVIILINFLLPLGDLKQFSTPLTIILAILSFFVVLFGLPLIL